MLIGQYAVKVSKKFQTAFPKKFREVLGDKLIVTQGFEGALIVVSEQGWKVLLEDAQKRPLTQGGARDTKRFLLGGAAFVDLDDKGRFIIPEYLRTYAQLQEEIIFLGQDTYVEIWDKNNWEAYNKELMKNISVIAEKLSQPVREERVND